MVRTKRVIYYKVAHQGQSKNKIMVSLNNIYVLLMILLVTIIPDLHEYLVIIRNNVYIILWRPQE